MPFTINGDTLERYEGEEERIVIPEGIKTIGEYAFHGCGMREAVFPEGLELIRNGAFQDCENLERIVLPDSVHELMKWAFTDCTALKEATLGKNTKYLGEYVFRGCANLEKIIVRASFTSIPFNAFEGCRKLTQAEYEGKTYRIERHKSEGLPWALDRIPHCFGLDPKKVKPYKPALRFPEGYPYMDEYEYLNTGGEEED